MTAIARRVRSTPVRTATETWKLIAELLTASDDTLQAALKEIGNLASMLIAEEHTQANPILLSGCGPQVRIYTLHGTEATDGANLNEQPLTITATDGWQLLLPATGTDLQLARSVLANTGHVDAYEPADTESADAPSGSLRRDVAAPLGSITVDLSALEA